MVRRSFTRTDELCSSARPVHLWSPLGQSRAQRSALLLSTVIAAIATFASWGAAHDLAPLIVFALLFGFFAYGFCSLRARIGTAISKEPTAALATFCIFVFYQGFGNVLAGPISAALLTNGVKRDGYGLWRFKGMVLFTGACMLLSAASVGLWHWRPRRMIAD